MSADRQAEARARMAAAMAAMGPGGVERLKKAMRRRVGFFVAGAAVAIAGILIPSSPFIWAPGAVMIAGGAIALLGMLGPSRGSSCMAQITVVVWLLAVGCGVGSGVVEVQYLLAGSAFTFALLALLLPKPRAAGPLTGLAGLAARARGSGSFASAVSPAVGEPARARDRIIDIEAEDACD